MKKDFLMASAGAFVACITMPILGIGGIVLGFATIVIGDLVFNK